VYLPKRYRFDYVERYPTYRPRSGRPERSRRFTLDRHPRVRGYMHARGRFVYARWGSRRRRQAEAWHVRNHGLVKSLHLMAVTYPPRATMQVPPPASLPKISLARSLAECSQIDVDTSDVTDWR
jgi:hypothetical protein